MSRVLELLGSDDAGISTTSDAVEVVRALIAAETGCTNIGPVDHSDCSSEVRVDLLESWRGLAQGPYDERSSLVGNWVTGRTSCPSC